MTMDASTYQLEPKADETGTGRINPVRVQGESEVRIQADTDYVFDSPTISRMNHGRIFEQYVKSSLQPGQEALIIPKPDGTSEVIRGPVENTPLELVSPNADFDGNVLAGIEELYPFIDPADAETISANKSLLYNKSSLEVSEYLNRKAQLLEMGKYIKLDQLASPRGYATDIDSVIFAPPRKIQKFIFEPGTVMSKSLDKIRTDLRLPYLECQFVVPMVDFLFDGITIPGGSYEVIGKELSETKFFFWLTFQEVELCVQVNCFNSKKHPGEYEYRAWMAEGPNIVLESTDSRTRYLKVTLTLIEPIFAFLEGLSKRKYSLLSNGVVIQGSHVPPPAAEGDVFKVLKYTTDKAYQQRIYKGGTHASPREHERIAHKRTLRNGEVRWFPQTTVNKGKTKGRVIKDYQIIDPTPTEE